MIKIYTIGYTGKTERIFREVLDAVGVQLVVDVRRWPNGLDEHWHAKDYLTVALGDKYRHMFELAPSVDILGKYLGYKIDWVEYERKYNAQIAARGIERLFTPEDLHEICFMCSEACAEKCHRRLAAEYLAAHFPGVKIIHL